MQAPLWLPSLGRGARQPPSEKGCFYDRAGGIDVRHLIARWSVMDPGVSRTAEKKGQGPCPREAYFLLRIQII